MKQNADRINYTLSNIFDNIAYVNTFIGKQIIKNNINTKNIYSVFKRNTSINNDILSLYSWTLYGWIDQNAKLIVDTTFGVNTTNSIDFSNRFYIKIIKNSPWSLFISNPVLGLPSHQPILSAALGIADNNNLYKGAILVGIVISKLASRLQQATLIGNKNEFLILDNKFNIVIKSNNLNFDPTANKQSLLKNYKSLSPSNSGNILVNPVNFESNIYYYIKKTGRYPFYVALGMNKELLHQELFNRINLVIIKILSTCGIALLILIAFRHYLINPIVNLSNIAENAAKGNLVLNLKSAKFVEIFNLSKAILLLIRALRNNRRRHVQLNNLNTNLVVTLDELSDKSNALEHATHELNKAIKIADESDKEKNYFVEQVTTELKLSLEVIANSINRLYIIINNSGINNKQMCFDLISKIIDSISELKNFAKHSLNLTLVDFDNLINTCLQITKKAAFEKKVSIALISYSELQSLYLDELKIKQVIVSLLYRAIFNSTDHEKIELTYGLRLNTSTNSQSIYITIQDDGFGLDEKDCERINSNFINWKPAAYTDIKLDVIEQLIKLHNGELVINSQWNKGTTVTIILPYKPSEKIYKNDTNIYTFPSNQ